MSAHTAGPWQIGEDDSFDDIPFIPIYVDGRKKIAEVMSTLDETSDEFRVTEEDRANARLIAAAPELLEALEDAERALKACRFDPTSNTMRDIRAAIARATTP